MKRRTMYALICMLYISPTYLSAVNPELDERTTDSLVVTDEAPDCIHYTSLGYAAFGLTAAGCNAYHLYKNRHINQYAYKHLALQGVAAIILITTVAVGTLPCFI